MASVYPGALDTLATNKANATGQTTDHPAHHNDLADAANKIEAELGVNPSGTEATVAAALAVLGSTAVIVTAAPYNADETGVADARAAMQSADDAVSAAGGGVAFRPAGTYKLASNNGTQKCMLGKAGVDVLGAGPKVTTFRLAGVNASFFEIGSTLGTTATVTANITVGLQNYTVDSSTGFAVGDVVFFNLGQDPSDSAESPFVGFATVTAVPDATHLTLDMPAEHAVTVGSVIAARKAISKVTSLVEGVTYKDFGLVSAGGASNNSEYGLYFLRARAPRLENLYCEHIGAGITWQFCDNVSATGIHVAKCEATSAQASKGRGLSFATVRGAHVEDVLLEKCEGTFVLSEFYSRDVLLENVEIRNNAATRLAGPTIFGALHGSDLTVRNVLYSGRTTGESWYNAGGTTPGAVVFENVEFRVDPRDMLSVPMERFAGKLKVKFAGEDTSRVYDLDKADDYVLDTLLTTSTTLTSWLPEGILLDLEIYVSPDVVSGAGNASGLDVYFGRSSNNGTTLAWTAGSNRKGANNAFLGAGTNHPAPSLWDESHKVIVTCGTGHTGNNRHVIIRARIARRDGDVLGNQPGSEQRGRFLPVQVVDDSTTVRSLASSAELYLTPGAKVLKITGTTTSTLTAATAHTGMVVTLIFAASMTLNNAASTKLAGAANFGATADDTITLTCDGTTWTEICRSVN